MIITSRLKNYWQALAHDQAVGTPVVGGESGGSRWHYGW
jgi:hypothetical protein